MKTPSTLVALVAVSTIGVGGATAADMIPYEQPAVVEHDAGFYIGSLSQVNFLDNTDFDVVGTGISTDYDAGYYTSLRAGYNFGSMGFVSPRMELELGYGSASVDEHRVSGLGGVGGIDSFGDARSFQGYVNGYLDIPLGADGFISGITPFVGGGVGFMNLELRKQGIAGVATLMDDNDTNFAYHLDAGVGIDLQSIGLFTNTRLFEKTTFDIGYRFTAADDFEFTARDGTSSSTDFRSHAVTFGFRKQF
jgi:opacity protein-like surface antigen